MNGALTTLACLLALLSPAAGKCKSGALTQFELAILDKHNALRALHKDTPNLCYGESGEDVTFKAQSWAQAMANVKKMEHSSGKYGENLAYAGTTGTVPGQKEAYIASTQAWYDEIKDWDFEKSAKKGSGVTGHFTQVVWKGSQQLNCGYATFKNNYNSYYVVCQYYPAGNYVGQYAAQVAELKKSGSGALFNGAVVAPLLLLVTLFLM